MHYLFRKIAEKHQLWTPQDSLLIAVSGGLDSMVLLDLCRQLYNPIAIVHCNFGLRGADADADQALVAELSSKHGLKLHTQRFATKAYAQEKGISIEMAARNLRYDYFQKLCRKYNYTKILTAHHANDNAETLLLNLTKGTGIKGLTGIPRKRDNIVRPLLAFTREGLQDYAKAHKITYREDLTNHETIFQRNKLRHDILPLLKEINPSVVQTLQADCERLQEVRAIYEAYITTRLQHLVRKKAISIPELTEEKHQQALLYEWLSPYGFSATVTTDILATLSETEEKKFYANSYRLLKSRGRLQLTTLPQTQQETFNVGEQGIKKPIALHIKPFRGKIEKSAPKVAHFDKDKLRFPLILRRWKKGDRFVPFGLKGSKKVSETFKDLKLTTVEKENVWLLCSGSDIIWVVGLRTDNRYKINAKTQEAIQIIWTE